MHRLGGLLEEQRSEATVGWDGPTGNRAEDKNRTWIPSSQRTQISYKNLNFKENTIKVARGIDLFQLIMGLTVNLYIEKKVLV